MKKYPREPGWTRATFTIMTILACIATAAGVALADTYYASPSGSNTPPYDSWATAANHIQDAIDASSTGDTVMVDAGTYPEHVQVSSKDIDLSGAGMGVTEIHGYRIDIQNVTGGSLRGFTVCEVSDFAVNLWTSDGYTVTGNEVVNAMWGIACFNSTNITVKGNHVHDCSDTGIGITTVSGGTSSAIVANNVTERCSWHMKGETNCTVLMVNNTCSGAYSGSWSGGVLSLGGTAAVTAYNNIITGVRVGLESQNGGALCGDNNNFWNIDNGYYYGNCSPGAGDTYVDPILTAHLHLMQSSPCRDNGQSAGAPADDYDNEARPQGTGMDRGADEWLDADDDGLPDWWETPHGDLDPQADDDIDGLRNIDEYYYGTDPSLLDSDGDGLSDGEEVTAGADGYLSDPFNTDTDGDGLEDGTVDVNLDGLTEGDFGTDPSRADTDGDGLPDYWEALNSACTDPLVEDDEADPDIDGAANWTEYYHVTDPCDNGQTPVLITVYVDDDAPNDPGPGDIYVSDPLEDGTPAHPYDSVQEALIALNTPGDRAEVLPGTYVESLYLSNAAGYLHGAGAGQTFIVATQPYACHAETILFGELSGFTFSGGSNGFELNNCNLAIRDCRIEEYQQLGILVTNSAGVTVEDTVFTGGQVPIQAQFDQNLAIRGCEARNWSGWAACDSYCTSGIAEDNHFHHSSGSGDVVQLNGDSAFTVSGNLIHDCPNS
ncbi:right-handed parallel beta-helix repeat-containing protein, partial [bacterium]|nr:right-handed parallel beta-helix repeat-containing protein [candidate division CSSED10-310 bacterium]